MAKRYYLAPMVLGPGPGGMQTWQPKIMLYPTDAVSAITPDDPTRPNAWAFCVVEAKDHTVILADVQIGALPDVSMDVRMSAVGATGRTQLDTSLAKFLLTASVPYNNSEAFREVLRRIGRLRLSSFDENAFDTTVS